jgi:hypothetical protein
MIRGFVRSMGLDGVCLKCFCLRCAQAYDSVEVVDRSAGGWV